MSPEQLRQYDRDHVWHPFTQMASYEPRIMERAAGCWLFDHEGKRYLDGTSSLWCNVHGHAHPHIDAAIREQLALVAHTTALGLSNPVTIRLARKLVELSPAGLEHVFFSDSGASAVEVALKMAFQYWRQCRPPQPGRNRFVAFAEAYHGDTLGSVSVGGVARFHAMFEPLLFDVLRVPVPDARRLPADVAISAAAPCFLDSLEQLLSTQGSEIAAVVMEPLVQCAAGMVLHPPGFLRGVRELTQRYNTLLILDEVATGFGRTGTLFACEQEEVTPDLLCLAKGLTGGYMPVAATLATNEIWQAFLGSYEESRTFFHGHTYGGNPLGCAAALASLELFTHEQTLAHLPEKMQRMAEHLQNISRFPFVRHVRQCGLIGAFDLVDPANGNLWPWEKKMGLAVCDAAWKRGLALRPLGSVLYAMPPLVISLEEIDFLFSQLEAALVEVFAPPVV